MATPSIQEDNPPNPQPPPSPPPPRPAFKAAVEVEETTTTIAQRFNHQVDALTLKADELEQRVKEVSQFYENKKQANNNNHKGISSNLRYKDKIAGNLAGKEVDCSKRMQEVMRQFGTIMKQLSQHKWAWPFMQPVDVEALELHDYYEVIKKPMDFTTIRNQMDANKYMSAREIYADVRLVFSNAMTYNEEKSDVHVMAKTLLEKFEEKWIQLLPKVIEAETRQKDEEARALMNMQISQELHVAKVARDTGNELNGLSLHLDELKNMVLQRCRKTSTEDKRKLGHGIMALSAENFDKVIEIISQANPDFLPTAEPGEPVDIDMDAQSEITLWRLKFFVKEALELQAKNEASKADNNITLRKKVIYDAFAKTAKKRIKNNP